MPDRRFGEPTPGQSHFHDEAMVVHDRTCDLVLQRSTRCSCRAGPDSGYEGVPLEGPRLEFRTFDDNLTPDAAAALRAENEELREQLRALRGGQSAVPRPRPGVASATAEPAGPPSSGLRKFRGR